MGSASSIKQAVILAPGDTIESLGKGVMLCKFTKVNF